MSTEIVDSRQARRRARKHESQSNEREVAIMLLGVTGSGKSSFVKALTEERVQVGHSLQACTERATTYMIRHNADTQVRLIDTPGFDDTARSDIEILEEIALALNDLLVREVPLIAILYFHRISDQRMSGAALKSLGIALRICGEQAYDRIGFVTTMWDIQAKSDPGFKIALEREAMLFGKAEFWRNARGRGADYHRLRAKGSSERDIITKAIERSPLNLAPVTLQMQLANERKSLSETAAGEFVESQLNTSRKRHEEALTTMKKELEELRASGDFADMNMLMDDIKKEEASISKDAEQTTRMRTSLARLLQIRQGDEEEEAFFQQQTEETTDRLPSASISVERGSHKTHPDSHPRQSRSESSTAELRQELEELQDKQHSLARMSDHEGRKQYLQRRLLEEDIQFQRDRQRNLSWGPLQGVADAIAGVMPRAGSHSSEEEFRRLSPRSPTRSQRFRLQSHRSHSADKIYIVESPRR